MHQHFGKKPTVFIMWWWGELSALVRWAVTTLAHFPVLVSQFHQPGRQHYSPLRLRPRESVAFFGFNPLSPFIFPFNRGAYSNLSRLQEMFYDLIFHHMISTQKWCHKKNLKQGLEEKQTHALCIQKLNTLNWLYTVGYRVPVNLNE